jgi:succinoglycan biosynthesis transport protein ExoP
MNLQQLIIILWVRRFLVLAYLSVTVLTTLTLSLMMPKQYVAETSLVLDQPGINPITGAQLPIQLTTGYMATQTDIIKSPTVALNVVDILGLMADEKELASFVKDAKLKSEQEDALETALQEGSEKLEEDEKRLTFKRKLLDDFRTWIAEGLMKKKPELIHTSKVLALMKNKDLQASFEKNSQLKPEEKNALQIAFQENSDKSKQDVKYAAFESKLVERFCHWIANGLIKKIPEVTNAREILELMKDKDVQISFENDGRLGFEEQQTLQIATQEDSENLQEEGEEITLKKELIKDYRNSIAEGLMKKLEVVPSRESNILGISFSATDPEFSAKAANTFAQAYIQTVNELKRQPAKETADWFDVQLEILRKSMEKARDKLSDFQQKKGIIIAASNEQNDLLDTKLAELSNQLIKSQLEAADLMSKKKLLMQSLADPESLKSLPEVLNSPVLQELKAGLAQAESKFADLAVRVDRNHPQYRQADAAIANLKKQIKTEMNTMLYGFNIDILASQNRVESLAKELAYQKEKVLQLKTQYNEIALLKREVENAQVAYDAVNQRSIQMRMESEIRQSSIAVLNQAVPPKDAAKPKVKLNVILAVLLGSILGIVAALFAEILDRRVRTPDDITDSLDLPVFGVVTAPSPPRKFSWSFFGARS